MQPKNTPDQNTSPLNTLLKTKFFVPPLPSEHVSRDELVEKLRRGTRRRLTLITAPAGYGKSTAIAELFAVDDRPSVCLSLDPSDNEPNRFWSHFGHALGCVFPGLGEEATATLTRPSPPDVRDVLTVWLNELASLDPRASVGLLALDDAHLVEHPEIGRELAFFIDHLAPSLRLILAARRLPDLPLARWRGRGQVCRITSRELLLDPRGSERYLAGRLGAALSPEQVSRLFERCEGWPAALQLAASWLAGSGRSADHRLLELPERGDVADYLAEEILAQMSPRMADRLMRLSILDAFHGPLCDAMLGRAESEGLIEYLESSNLPVVRLDGRGFWLRFHHLFRDFLRRQLQRRSPGLATELHAAACDFFTAEEEWRPAYRHARAADDLDRSLDVLCRSASIRINRGESEALVRDVESLGSELEDLPPDLLLELAKAAYIAGRLELCRAALATLERLEDKDLLLAHQRAMLQVQRAALARSRDGDLKTAIRQLSSALELLPASGRPLRPWVELQLSIAHVYAFQLDPAAAMLSRRDSPVGEAGPVPIFSRRANLAQIHLLRGNLEQAEQICRGVLDRHESRPAPLGSPGLSLAFRTLGAVELERGAWEKAGEALEQAVRCGRLSGFDELLAFPLLWLAELARTTGHGATDGYLDEVERLELRGNLAPVHTAWKRALRLHLLLDAGDQRGAERLARRFPPSRDAVSMLDEPWRIAWMRARATSGDVASARHALSRHLDYAVRQGRSGMEVELRLWGIWLDQRARRRGASEELSRRLAETLEQAAEQGMVRPFLTAPLTELVGLFDRVGPLGLSDRASKLCRRIVTEPTRRAPKRKDESATVGPRLTGKENEVLAGLAEGRSNAQIAADLGIAVSTVKTHLKNLFSKLDARRRTQAVARARELGCL